MSWTEGIPIFNSRSPPEERRYLYHLSRQLATLALHVDTFAAAVSLVDHCAILMNAHLAKYPRELFQERYQQRALAEDWMSMAAQDRAMRQERDLIGNWMGIAARDAAMTIYHFRSTLKSIRDSVGRCRSLKAKMDMPALKKALDRLEHEFPLAKAMRDAVSHSADNFFTPDHVEKNRTPEGMIISNGMNIGARRLTMTVSGKFLHLDVTTDTLVRLNAIKQDLFDAFRKGCVL
jgi:hypothetical protein